ncbi:MAG: hypothetical protein DIZ80_15565 [endosymbiont of Galathealinum brachiosum]|uniref:Uncharacterized protein n=1 Tax=endosymbiont of Galathealinum brachiosum TaxID=2200906 RepID=A0A370DBD7_9GAMM|nr:MAG: hypothetical protein DIZ80_15565 [endosymbiont of Galathealinum brachiosum]
MTKFIFLLITAVTVLSRPCYSDNAMQIYSTTKTLEGEWVLSADKQQGKATKHKLVAPLVGTDVVAMNFKLVGKGSTVQETLLPDTKKEMVSMYHCKDVACSEVKATHYCVKQNQPEMLANPLSTSNRLIYDCDMTTALCKSGQNHIHKITHEISNKGNHLKTTYTSWKASKYLKDSIYHFDRK